VWTWQPKKAGLPAETRKQACNLKLVIKRVPFSLNRSASGVSVKVQLPNGTTLSDSNVMVEDVFVVAMGDSFASGESNPDRPVPSAAPVRWSTIRSMRTTGSFPIVHSTSGARKTV
jgi:hypothetical protein